MAFRMKQESSKNYQAPEGHIFLADIKNREHLSDKTLSNILKGHPSVRVYRMGKKSLNLVNAYAIAGLYELLEWWTATAMTEPERLKKIAAREAKLAEIEREKAKPVQTFSNVSEVFARVAREMRAERERFWG